MATDLDEDEEQQAATSRSPDPAQRHYDEEFGALTSPEHYGRDAEEPDALRDAEENPNDDGFFKPYDHGADDSPVQGPLTEDQQAAKDKAEKYQNQREAKLQKQFSSKSFFKKKWAIAGAVGGGSIIASIVVFLALLPLKIEHIVANIDQHFGAASAQALDTETQNLFSTYVTRQVLPGIQNGRCHSTIEPGCVGAINGSGPVATLFTAWKDGRLEQKMATKYGIIVGKKGNTYYLNVNAHSYDLKSGEDIFNLPGTKQADRQAIRAAVKAGLKDASLYDRLYTRFKYGILLQRKHQLKRCVISCDINDKFTDTFADKKLAAKAYLLNRVIGPFSQAKALIMTCILAGNCDTDPSQKTNDPNNPERISKFNIALQDKLAAYAADHSAEKLADLIAEANDASKKGGLTKYITKQIAQAIVDKVGGGDAAKAVAGETVDKFIPVAGWITFGSSIVYFLHTGGQQLKALNYATDSTAAVSTYMSYKTVADEVHSGHMDATELGSFTDQLNNGGVDATSTPLYNDIVNGSSGSTTTASLLSAASADSIVATTTAPSGSSYLCADGKPVPAGQKVCDEENFTGGSTLANAISNGFNSIPGADALSTLAGLIHSAAATISGYVGDVLSFIPGVSDALNAIGKLAQPLFGMLTKYLLPNPFADGVTNGYTTSAQTSLLSTPKVSADTGDAPILPGGGRTFDLIAGGADVAQNESCQIELGCAQITDQQAATIQGKQLTEQKTAFEHASVFARMFDTSTPYSLVSRLAVAMPSGIIGSLQELFSSLLGNPFGKLAGDFASIFSSNHAFAASPAQPDPFGVVQTGYTDAQIPADPDTYWNQHCQAFASDPSEANGWLDNQVANQDTGEAVAKTPNPCLLIQASAQSAGGLFDSSLLPAGSQNDVGSEGATTEPTTPGSYQNPLRDVKNLGQSRVDQGVDYTGSGPVYAIGNGVVKNLTNSGWPGGTFIVYQLTDGPAQGKYIYVAENCSPIKVSIGDTVNANTVLCNMINASPYIETGWANGAALGESMAHDVWVGNDSDAYFTAFGKNFSDLLQSLGAPQGTIASGAQQLGSLPSGWPTWQ